MKAPRTIAVDQNESPWGTRRAGSGGLPLVVVLALLAGSVVLGMFLRSHLAGDVAMTSSDNQPARLEKSTSANRLARGEAVFQMYCARCHGPEGRGDGDAALHSASPPPRDFASRPWRLEVSRTSIRCVIQNGLPGTAMPAAGSAIAGDDLDALVEYVFTLARREPSAESPKRSPIDHLLAAAGFAPVRRPAPELSIVTADGTTVDLTQWRGELVLLNFWGTTCEHCLRNMPKLAALAREYQSRGPAVLHVCADSDDAALAQSVADQAAPGSKIYVDTTGLANQRFDVQMLPTLWLVAPDGQLLGKSHGKVDFGSDAVKKLLDYFLPKHPNASAPE